MKILNVMFTTRLGGLEQAFLDYTSALQIAKIDVISIIHSMSPIISKIEGVFHKVHNFSKYDPIALYKLRQIILKEQPQVILTHGNRAHFMITKVAGEIPVVGVLHTFSFDYISKCDYVISVSTHMRHELIAHGYPENKVYYVPNMIRIPEGSIYKEPTLHDIPTIGLIARIEKTKGVDIFINALNILKQRNISFLAKIAGNGSDYNEIQKLIANLNLNENVEMIGWVEDKAKFYREIDIVCMPSRVEPFGIVILEAFLNSKPIIVSDSTGPVEIVEDEYDALMFKGEDFVSLANQLERFISDKGLITKLTQNGFKKVKLYDINFISDSITNIIKKVT